MPGLPHYWSGDAVNDANLMDTLAGPWSAVVDDDLSANSGNLYTNLQDAWDAAAAGDSILVKRGQGAGGLNVSTALGNAKDNMRVVGDAGWRRNGTTQSAHLAATARVEDVDGCEFYGLTVKGNPSGSGWWFENCTDLHLERLRSEDSIGEAFVLIHVQDSKVLYCKAESPASRGCICYDSLKRLDFVGCESNGSGSHGFNLSAFPVVNGIGEWVRLRDCMARYCGGSGNGFSVTVYQTGSTYGVTRLHLLDCQAYANAGDGFYLYNGSAGSIVNMRGCLSDVNTSAGFRVTGTAPGAGWQVMGNEASGNGGGNAVGTWTGATGVAINGLTSPGTNRW